MSVKNNNTYKMNKSQLWSTIKAYGNPDQIKWTASIPTMFESVQNAMLLQELQMFQNFEPFKPSRGPKISAEDFFDSEIFIPEAGSIDIDKKKGDAEELKEFIERQPAESMLEVNGKLFYWGGRDINGLISKIYDEIDYIEELHYEEIYDEPVEGEEDDQVYRLGDQNCLITPIRQKLVETLENAESETYQKKIKIMLNKVNTLVPDFNQHGATPELIQKLANATESKIVVYEVVSQTKRIFQASKVQRRFKFKFQNISINHVQLWSGKNEETIIQTQKEFDTIVDELKSNNQTFKIQNCNGFTVKVNTGLNTYVLKDFQDLYTAEQEINDMTRDLAVTINRQAQQESLSWFILATLTQFGGIKLGDANPETLKHIDARQSYSQFQSLPEQYRHGFAYLTDFRKVSSVDFAIKHNGFYKIFIHSRLPPHIATILGDRPHHILASNIIQYLYNNHVKMTIEGGVYGKHSKQITLGKSAYKEHCKRKAYYTAFSKYGITSDSITEFIHCGDPKLARIIQNKLNWRMIDLNEYSDGLYSITVQKEKKQFQKTRAHVYGYVLQCQMLNLMLQLEKMDMTKVKLIYGDDIYYQDHKFEKLDIFREKSDNKYNDLVKNVQPQFLRIPHNDVSSFIYGEEQPVYYQYQLHQGPGGFGKTHRCLADKGNINQVYTTLTNKLVNEQKNSIFKPKAYTTAMFQAKHAQFKLNTTNVVIDEIGLCETGIIEFIKREMPYARIYVLGDDLQISGRKSNPFDHSLYHLVLDESNFKTDYRASNCQKLQDLKQQIRSAMRHGKTEQEIYTQIVQPNSQQITVNQWIQQYNSDKMIVTCSNDQKDIWTGRLEDKFTKYRVSKSFVHNTIQYYTGDILDTLPEGFDYEKNSKLKTPNIKKQFAFTCHSLQGCTHNNQLLVQMPINLDMFKGFCYTAVSRLTKIEHLFTLQYKPKTKQVNNI